MNTGQQATECTAYMPGEHKRCDQQPYNTMLAAAADYQLQCIYKPGMGFCHGLQVTGVRAERDMLAHENATLAATTNQLMAGATAAAAGDDEVPIAACEGSFGSGNPRSRTTSAPPTPGGVARLSAAATAASSLTGPSTTNITPGQLKEIGQMLARLTRENAALIKQRDRLEAAIAPAQAEAQRATAAAEAAVSEKQAVIERRDKARSEADGVKAELQKALAALKQLTAEKDRLQQQVTYVVAVDVSACVTVL